MVGNDVVDLGDAEAREGATHPGFDARVFDAREREALAASGAPNRLRWLLWAAKEAAYKAGRRENPELVFSPRRFEVHLDAGLSGTVRHPDGSVPVTITEDADAVHAVARAPGDAAILCGIARRPEEADASVAVRQLARERIAAHLGCEPDALRFERDGRIPRLRVPGIDRALDVSLSHHGRFVAFACDTGAP